MDYTAGPPPMPPGGWTPPVAEVRGVQFGLLTADDIVDSSALQTVATAADDVPNGGRHASANPNVTVDARLGTTQRYTLCGTCGSRHDECTLGHTGHMHLSVPVPNVECLWTLQRLLNCVCWRCARLRLPPDYDTYVHVMRSHPDARVRLKRLYDTSRRRQRCELAVTTKRRRLALQRQQRREKDEPSVTAAAATPEVSPEDDDVPVTELLARNEGCGAIQPFWQLKDGLFLRAVFDVQSEDLVHVEGDGCPYPELTPEDVVRILSRVRPEDMRELKIDPDHAPPESYMWSTMYLPPITIRQSKVGAAGGTRVGDDDLTVRLKAIERWSQQMGRALHQDVEASDHAVASDATAPTAPTAVTAATFPVPALSLSLTRYRCGKREFERWSEAVTWLRRRRPTDSNGSSSSNGASEEQPMRTAEQQRAYNKSLMGLYDRGCVFVALYQNDQARGVNKLRNQRGKRGSIRSRYSGNRRFGGGQHRMRNHANGKRTDFIARSVVTPDASLAVNEVSVSHMVATYETVPETVTPYNVARLTDMVRNGPDVYPGAHAVVTADGRTLSLYDPLRRQQLELCCGMQVVRHLLSGDPVLMNRAPTLHKPSIMAHRLRVVPGQRKTFGLPLAVTPGYNADFDGDEMHMLFPQSTEARAEAVALMDVSQNIMKDHVPIVQFVQNAVLGCYLLTQPDTRVPWDVATQMWTQAGPEGRVPDDAVPHSPLTGHVVFSGLVPTTLCLRYKTIVIEAGRMVAGTWTKDSLNASGGLVHTLVRVYGNTRTAQVMTGIYHALEWFLQRFQGSSVCLDDVDVPDAALPKRAFRQRLRQLLGKSVPQTKAEAAQRQANLAVLGSRARDLVSAAAKTQLAQRTRGGVRNGLHDEVTSQAKGRPDNLDQMTAMLGQQWNHNATFYTDVPPHMRTGGARDELVAGGMVFGSFSSGLGTLELHRHAASSISGLVDTAVKTADIGYMHRKMAKMLEDVRTNVLGSTVTANGMLLEPLYGGDGFLTDQVERDTVPCLLDGAVDPVDEDDPTLCAWRAQVLRQLHAHAVPPSEVAIVFTPFHWPHERLRAGPNLNPTSPVVSRTEWEAWWDRLVHVARLHSRTPPPKLRLYLRTHWWRTWHHVERRPTVDVAATLMARAEACFGRAWVPEGEMVGFVASQSLGEPITQMTLRTFHHAGSAQTQLVGGVPRLRELLSLTRKPKTPTMVLVPRDTHLTDATLQAYADALVPQPLRTWIVQRDAHPSWTAHAVELRAASLRRRDAPLYPTQLCAPDEQLAPQRRRCVSVNQSLGTDNDRQEDGDGDDGEAAEGDGEDEEEEEEEEAEAEEEAEEAEEEAEEVEEEAEEEAEEAEEEEGGEEEEAAEEEDAEEEVEEDVGRKEVMEVEEEPMEEEEEEEETPTGDVQSNAVILAASLLNSDQDEEEEDDDDDDDDNDSCDDGTAGAPTTMFLDPSCAIDDNALIALNDGGKRSVFDAHANHFFFLWRLSPTAPKASLLVRACRRSWPLPSVGWVWGTDWFGVCGVLCDRNVRQWVVNMGLQDFHRELLFNLLDDHLSQLLIGGLRGIRSARLTEDKVLEPEAPLRWRPRTYVVTHGSNLRQALQLPWVDTQQSYSSHVAETEALLGISAAQLVMRRELMHVFDVNGVSVRSKHVQQLVNRIGASGRLTTVNAKGVLQLNPDSVWRNASFENGMEVFMRAAQLGTYNPCHGVTECALVNRSLEAGTGLVHLRNRTTPRCPPEQPWLHDTYPTLLPPSSSWLRSLDTPPCPAAAAVIPAAHAPQAAAVATATTGGNKRRASRTSRTPRRSQKPRGATTSQTQPPESAVVAVAPPVLPHAGSTSASRRRHRALYHSLTRKHVAVTPTVSSGNNASNAPVSVAAQTLLPPSSSSSHVPAVAGTTDEVLVSSNDWTGYFATEALERFVPRNVVLPPAPPTHSDTDTDIAAWNGWFAHAPVQRFVPFQSKQQ